MRSPHSTVPEVRVLTGVSAVTCSECGLLSIVFPSRPGADLLADEHRKSHAPKRSE